MLARFSGASSGIREYLETGSKKSSDYTRDELDQRVVLMGDIEVMDKIIDLSENKGDKYMHITLSFKEDYIAPEILRQIADDYTKALMVAYGADEYSIYAEAHLPKIKTVTHKATGEIIERKPHIHIVIPKTNLMTGQVLNPVRLYEMDEKYLQAIQEKINQKYGLASPRDNPRIGVNHNEDVVARWTAQYMADGNKAIKERILQVVLQNESVKDGDSLVTALKEQGFDGDFRWRKSDPDYLNIKLNDQKKGANLKEYVFSKEFLALPLGDKKRALELQVKPASFAGENNQSKHVDEKQLSRDVSNARRSAYQERRVNDDEPDTDAASYSSAYTPKDERLLQQWLNQRAHELKYIDCKNTTFKRAYKLLDQAKKLDALEALKQVYKQRNKENQYVKHQYGREKISRQTSDRSIRDAAISRVIDFAKTIEFVSRLKLHHLSRGFVVRQGDSIPGQEQKKQRELQSTGMLLSGTEHGHLPSRDYQNSGLLRRGANDGRADESRLSKTRNSKAPLSVISQSTRDAHASIVEQALEKDSATARIRDIKQSVSLKTMLPYLESHQLDASKYKTANYPDGQRIVCGKRNLTCSDFLTKELHLTWPQANEVLNKAYDDIVQGRSKSYQTANRYDQRLWKEFSDSDVSLKETDDTIKLLVKNSNSTEIRDMQQQYRVMRKEIIAEFGYASTQAKQRLAILNFDRVNNLEKLRERHRNDQAKARLTRQHLNGQYATYLSSKAGQGDFKALQELQRIVQNNDIFARENFIIGKSKRDRLDFEKLAYRVDKYGAVTYSAAILNSSKNNASRHASEPPIDLFVDKGGRAIAMDVLLKDSDKMQLYVAYCLEKYGSNMQVQGTDEFKRNVELQIHVLHNSQAKGR